MTTRRSAFSSSRRGPDALLHCPGLKPLPTWNWCHSRFPMAARRTRISALIECWLWQLTSASSCSRAAEREQQALQNANARCSAFKTGHVKQLTAWPTMAACHRLCIQGLRRPTFCAAVHTELSKDLGSDQIVWMLDVIGPELSLGRLWNCGSLVQKRERIGIV